MDSLLAMSHTGATSTLQQTNRTPKLNTIMKTHINLWDLISKKACTDEETKELQSSLGLTNRYNMQEITLESRHDFTEKETSAWVIHIHSCDSSCNDNIQIVIPHDRFSPITVEEHIEVTKFITHKASTEDDGIDRDDNGAQLDDVYPE